MNRSKFYSFLIFTIIFVVSVELFGQGIPISYKPLNDSTEIMVTASGREVNVKYRNPIGKTYSIKQKDSLYKKYETLDIQTFIGFPTTIIVLYTPDDLIQYAPKSILNTMSTNTGKFVDTKDWGVERKWLNKPISSISLTDLNGKKFILSETNRQIRVLNFWFIACVPCVAEMPILNEVKQKYVKKAVDFIAIGNDEEDPIKEFIRQQPFDYNLVPSSRSIAEIFGITAYPTHIIIDKKGVIRFIKTGVTGNLKRDLNESIEKLLSED